MKFSLPGQHWRTSSAQDNQGLSEYFESICQKRGLDASKASYSLLKLPFYDETSYLTCIEFENESGLLAFIYHIKVFNSETEKDEFHYLNGRSEPIHHVSKTFGFFPTMDNIINFVCFFGFFVHSQAGPFYTLMDDKDQRISPEIWTGSKSATGLEYDALSAIFRKPCVRAESDLESKCFFVSALIYHVDTVSACDFQIENDGYIMMRSDDLLLEDLPFTLQVDLQP